uniref:Uncharacterized protein n=1 Tax=Mimiviridae sp. ChoanoV1 TaxID=2596887 RepID=A0A5B8HY27_9VIRU|nr:hypothetical protein 3_99 [Mimiviridae sp. ChoanoV1]
MKENNFCNRCHIIKKKLLECSRCSEKTCHNCLIEIYPSRKNEILELNSKNKNNYLTDLCYFNCNNNLKYCNDCGEKLNTIRRCKGCYISLCYECKKNKSEKNLSNYYFTRNEKFEITNYCTVSCYIIHSRVNRDNVSNCYKCLTLFINPYQYKNCISCRFKDIVEKNIEKNKKRKILQNQVKELLDKKEIDKDNFNNYCQKKIQKYIEKFNKINSNKVTLDQWLKEEDIGNHSCFNIWDYSIEKYINN